jgi:hypothetical protein
MTLINLKSRGQVRGEGLALKRNAQQFCFRVRSKKCER